MKKNTLSIMVTILTLTAAMVMPSSSLAQTQKDDHGNNSDHYALGHLYPTLPTENHPGYGSQNVPPAPQALPPTNNSKNNSNSATSSWYDSLFNWFNASQNNNHAYASTSHNWNSYGYGNNDNGNDSGSSTASTSASSASTTSTNLPPVISGVSSPTTLQVNQTGTWTVSASDPQNGQLSYMVNWGDNAPRPLFFASFFNQPFVQTSTFTHSYSKAGVYTVTFTVKDSAGLTTTSSITVNVVTSTSGPVISDVNATSTTLHYATLTWNTNENSDSEIWYSTTTPVDTSVAPQVSHPALVFDHKVVLSGLNSGTTYYAIVGSKDSNGNLSTSSQTSFTTKAPADAAPVITSITGSSTITAGVQGTWSINAYDPQNETLTYSVNWGDTGGIMKALFAAFKQPVYLQSSTFTHTYANPGIYTITVTVINSSGLSTTSTTSINVTATISTVTIPVISNVTATSASTTATFSWNTDQNSDSTVYYSTTSPVVIGATSTDNVTDPTLTTSHSLDLSGLATSTTYYFVVQSSDSAGISTSSQSSFTTSS